MRRSMHYFLRSTIGRLLGTWAILTGGAACGDQDLTPVDAVVESEADAPTSEVIQQVERIRSELGGSAVERFSELRTDESGSAWSWRDLQVDASDAPERNPQLHSPVPQMGPRGAPSGTWPNWMAAPQQARTIETRTLQGIRADGSRQRRALVLREVAQDLDNSANRLELLEDYELADSIRMAAQRLRLSARKLTADAKAADAPPPPAWSFGPPARRRSPDLRFQQGSSDSHDGSGGPLRERGENYGQPRLAAPDERPSQD